MKAISLDNLKRFYNKCKGVFADKQIEDELADALHAINGDGVVIEKALITQESGDAEDKVMSQKAVTEAIASAGDGEQLLYEVTFEDNPHVYADDVNVSTMEFTINAGLPSWFADLPADRGRKILLIDHYFEDKGISIGAKTYESHLKNSIVFIEETSDNSFIAYKSGTGATLAKIKDNTKLNEFAFCKPNDELIFDISGWKQILIEEIGHIHNSVASRYGLIGSGYYYQLNQYPNYLQPVGISMDYNDHASLGYKNFMYPFAGNTQTKITIKRGVTESKIEVLKISNELVGFSTENVNNVERYTESNCFGTIVTNKITTGKNELYIRTMNSALYGARCIYTPHSVLKIYGLKKEEQ